MSRVLDITDGSWMVIDAQGQRLPQPRAGGVAVVSCAVALQRVSPQECEALAIFGALQRRERGPGIVFLLRQSGVCGYVVPAEIQLVFGADPLVMELLKRAQEVTPVGGVPFLLIDGRAGVVFSLAQDGSITHLNGVPIPQVS